MREWLGMNNSLMHNDRNIEGELIATFGCARLIKDWDNVRLVGGNSADRAEALEWISFFLPDEVVRSEE